MEPMAEGLLASCGPLALPSVSFIHCHTRPWKVPALLPILYFQMPRLCQHFKAVPPAKTSLPPRHGPMAKGVSMRGLGARPS